MKKIFIFVSVFLIATFSHASDDNQEHCDIEKFNLSIYKKSDYKFISKACSKNEQTSVENFLVSKNQDNIFVNKKFEQGDYESTILEAVSIYNKNKTKPPYFDYFT